MNQITKYIQKKKDTWLDYWNTKKDQYLTIMLVPHTNYKSYKINISYKYIYLFLLATSFTLVISIINLLNHNFQEYEMTELELSNADYEVEIKKLSKETQELHKLAKYYDDKIRSLFLKIGGDKSKVLKSISDENLKILETYMNESNLTDKSIPVETYQLEYNIHILEKNAELLEDIIQLIQKKNSIVKNTPSIWPVEGYILFPFGKYISPLTGRETYNTGIDIGTFPNVEVRSTAPGTVLEIGYAETAGYYVKIAHKFGWKTFYSNMDRLRVKKDQVVTKDSIIGYVGKIPGKKFYHLHYEVHVGTTPLNPTSFLNQAQN